MYFTYILRSKKNGIYYVGYSKDINARLEQHNTGRSRSTKANIPWELYYVEEFNNEESAVRRERQIKSWKSRSAIEGLKL